MTRRRSAAEPRSPFAMLAAIVRVAVVAVLLALLLIGLGQSPLVANWLAGAGADSPQVGLIAGHWQSDSGAVCPDGLREVDLNLQIARQVAAILREEGYRVEVLPEFSAKLNGYRADVLLSIHNDSCVELSGFKVARMTHATVPEDEDRLVAALYEQYGAATGLEPHLDTITEDMRQYHAFRQIDPGTPGAIIECGFMGGDRYILTEEQDRVAVGIANGLLAFLRAENP